MTTKEHAQGNKGAVPTEATTPSYVPHRDHTGTSPAARTSPFTNVGVHAFINVMQVRMDLWESRENVSINY
jgi:hypothetical protein